MLTSSTGLPILTRRSSTRSASAARSIFDGNAHPDRPAGCDPTRRRRLRSADPQKDDPGENNEHGDRPLRVERFAQRHDADDRREHDRRLAKGGDGGDRGSSHRPDDDRIAEKGGDAPDEATPPALHKGDGDGASAKT